MIFHLVTLSQKYFWCQILLDHSDQANEAILPGDESVPLLPPEGAAPLHRLEALLRRLATEGEVPQLKVRLYPRLLDINRRLRHQPQKVKPKK